MRKALKKTLLFQSMTFLGLMSSVVAFSLSWFTTSLTNKVDEMDFRANYAIGVKFSDNSNTWYLDHGLKYGFKLRACTGNGYDFFALKENEVTTTRDLENSFYGIMATYEDITKHFDNYFTEMDAAQYANYVLEDEYVIETTAYCNLKVGKESSITAPYGDQFSTLAIAALRVGFYVYDSDAVAHLVCLWFPNAHTQAIINEETGKYEPGEGDIEDTYYFFNKRGSTLPSKLEPNSDNDAYVKTGDSVYYKDTINNILYVWGDFTDDVPPITSVLGAQPMKQVIWLEGNDRESNSIFGASTITTLTGKMAINIIFHVDEMEGDE